MSSDQVVGSRTWGVLGVPSSVAAHWPGIEQGPAALRTAGFVETLRDHGSDVGDHGDLPVARWNADVTPGRPNAWQQVVDVVATARAAIAEVIAADQAPLLLGGECTLAIAVPTPPWPAPFTMTPLSMDYVLAELTPKLDAATQGKAPQSYPG
jgi:arginase family enzyme